MNGGEENRSSLTAYFRSLQFPFSKFLQKDRSPIRHRQDLKKISETKQSVASPSYQSSDTT